MPSRRLGVAVGLNASGGGGHVNPSLLQTSFGLSVSGKSYLGCQSISQFEAALSSLSIALSVRFSGTLDLKKFGEEDPFQICMYLNFASGSSKAAGPRAMRCV